MANFVLGHEVIVKDQCEFELSDENIDTISEALIQGLEEGVIVSDGEKYSWEVFRCYNHYIDEKIQKLKNNKEVILEYEDLIYEVFLNSEGVYEYNVFRLDKLKDGNEDPLDGGICDGSARDAIYAAIDELSQN